MLVGGKWFWCCKDNIIFPLRRHRTARVFPTRRAFSVRPPHSTRWVALNCAFLPYLFTSSAPFFGFLLLFSSTSRYEEANIGNFPLKVPRFSSKVPHFRVFTPAFCSAPRTAHPPRAVRCIFPPHLRSATGGTPPLIGDTFSKHDTKAHDSHNNSMLSLPFFHSNSTFVV